MTAKEEPEIPNFPFPAGPFGAPAPEHDRRRAECPLGQVRLPGGQLVNLVVGYDDVKALLTEPALVRSTAPFYPEAFHRPDGSPRFMINMDPPRHTRIRRIVQSAFTPGKAAKWRPVAEEIADQLIDDMLAAGPPADLAAAYSNQVPDLFGLSLLGVPELDREQFNIWQDIMLSSKRPTTAEERTAAVDEMVNYLRRLVARRRAEPSDDLIDVLISARDDQERLTEDELIDMILMLLWTGRETTGATIARGMVSLLRNPGQYRLLHDDPGVLGTAVEELVRYDQAGDGGPLRVATKDIELPSGTIPAGNTIKVYIPTANRDPAHFPDPHRLDLRRDPNPHIAYGGGIHYCLGAALARMEMEVAFGTLARRLPALRLAVPAEQIEYNTAMLHRPVRSIPVTW